MKHKRETIQETVKQVTEAKILVALKDGRLRWSELKQKLASEVKSTRTLSDRVKSLAEKGLIKRTVNHRVYPPQVYYERTEKTSILELPENSFLKVLATITQERENDLAIIQQMLKTWDPEDIIWHLCEDIVLDFLFTLRNTLEHPKIAPYLVFLSAESYATKLKSLASSIEQIPSLVDAIKKIEGNNRAERKKDREEFFDKLSAPFADKALAKAIMVLYSVSLALGKTDSKPLDFVQQIGKDNVLRNALAKTSGLPIDDKRLKAILKDEAWLKMK
jgi:DNA-binding HxlR family transcriptional regulator